MLVAGESAERSGYLAPGSVPKSPHDRVLTLADRRKVGGGPFLAEIE